MYYSSVLSMPYNSCGDQKPSHYVGPRNQIQVVRPSRKHLYLLSYLWPKCLLCLSYLWYQYTKSQRVRSETCLVGSQLKDTWVLRIPFPSSPSTRKIHRMITLLPHDPERFLHPQGSIPPLYHFLHLCAHATDRLAMFCPLCFWPACCLGFYCQCLSLSTYVWSHNHSEDIMRAVGNWIWLSREI